MDNMGETESRAHNIKTIETRPTRSPIETIQLLHKTFITPIDRDEIHQLITRMDDILDLMEDVSQSVFLYDIRKVPDERSARRYLRRLHREGKGGVVPPQHGNAEKIMKI